MADLRTLAKRIAASKTDEGLVSELWSHMRPEEGKLLAEELSGVLLDERIDQMERQRREKSDLLDRQHQEKKAAQLELQEAEYALERGRLEQHGIALARGGRAVEQPDTMSTLAATITRLIELQNAPREIVRDSAGRVTHVRIAAPSQEARAEKGGGNLQVNPDGSVSVTLANKS